MNEHNEMAAQTGLGDHPRRGEFSGSSEAKDSDCGCGASTGDQPSTSPAHSHIYSIGKIEARFGSLGLEKEVAQVVGRVDSRGKTDEQTLHAVLSQRENRYLLREIGWVMRIQELDTYLLQPRDPADFDLLLEAISPATHRANRMDVVIGKRGPLAPPNLCGGLVVPIVFVDQIYSCDQAEFIKAIPRPEKMPASQFGPIAEELFNRIMQLTDNAGATDEHRALNYLAVRYPAIYAQAAQELARNCSLTDVEVRPSSLSTTRTIVEVIFSYTDRSTAVVTKSSVRCDVTEEFPFLVSKLGPFFDRRS